MHLIDQEIVIDKLFARTTRIHRLGAIQIIRDTLGEWESGQCHQKTREGVSRDIISKNYRLHFGTFACLKHSFLKNLNVTSHTVRGGVVTEQCHQMTQGGRP